MHVTSEICPILTLKRRLAPFHACKGAEFVTFRINGPRLMITTWVLGLLNLYGRFDVFVNLILLKKQKNVSLINQCKLTVIKHDRKTVNNDALLK